MDNTAVTAGRPRSDAQQPALNSSAPGGSHVASARQRLARHGAPFTASSWVQALPPATRYILRGGPQVMAAAGTALGLAISQTACRAATANVFTDNTASAIGTPTSVGAGGLPVTPTAALWLGPDEQLLLAPESVDLATLLGPALRDLPHSVRSSR